MSVMGSGMNFEGQYDELFGCGLRAARRIVMDPEAAADIASEAVARAFVRWSRIEGYAPAWVTRVAVNLALSEVRRRRVPADAVHFTGGGEPSADRVALAAQLARLPKRQREALVFRFLLDMDEEQTAEVLGVSMGTVHTHVKRALAHMREPAIAQRLLAGEV